jgi:hypothetical protein
MAVCPREVIPLLGTHPSLPADCIRLFLHFNAPRFRSFPMTLETAKEEDLWDDRENSARL